MAGVVKFTVFGENLWEHRMRNLKAYIFDPRPVLEEIADDQMKVINATFTSQGRRYGGSWHFLDKDTILEKVRAKEDPRILIATGKLKDAYTIRGDEYQVLHVTRHGITLGSTLGYAGAHQYGTDDIPQRQFIKFFPQDKARWARMMEEAFEEAWRGAGATKARRIK